MDASSAIELIGKVLVVTVLMLLLVAVCLFFLHFYNKASRNTASAVATAALFRFLVHGGGEEEEDLSPLPSHRRRGLDPWVLKLIPVVSADELKEKLECAVCICDISEGEKARVLRHCNHGFHVDCIDMWFLSNSTCPVCRNPVSDLEVEAINDRGGRTLGGGVEFPQPNASSITLTSSSSSSTPIAPNGGSLVIDIPLQINETEEEEEDEANPPTPPVTRLNSIKTHDMG